MDMKSALEIYKHIRDELEYATNPSLIPTKLQELKEKLHTLVADLEQELANVEAKYQQPQQPAVPATPADETPTASE